MSEPALCSHDWKASALGERCAKCGAELRAVAPSRKKHELVFNEIDRAVSASLGLAFCDDQEMAIRKAIIAAFIAYENFEA
jgi:ribosomal protein L34E